MPSLRTMAWRAGRLPGGARLGRGLYRLGLVDFTRLARSLPGVRTAAVHHGTPGDPWVPGLSDIDLALSVEDGGTDFLGRFWPHYAVLRRRWPFLQEVVIATPAEWQALARDPIAGAQVLRCEVRWGEPLPAVPETLPWEQARARLIRALNLYLEHASTFGWRHPQGDFQKAFARRVLGKIADLAQAGSGRGLSEDPASAWGETLALLENACALFWKDPAVAGQPDAEVGTPAPGPGVSAGIASGLRAAQAASEGLTLPEGVHLRPVLDPLRNGFLRFFMVDDRIVEGHADRSRGGLTMLVVGLAMQAPRHPLDPHPVVLGPMAWRFLSEVRDPLLGASVSRDLGMSAWGPAPSRPKRVLLDDWASWECRRMGYVLRLLGRDPEGLYPGYLEHQWRRGLALRAWLKDGLLSPGHDALLEDVAYARFAAAPGRGWAAARPHLEEALALSQTLLQSSMKRPLRTSSTDGGAGRA